MILYRFWDIAIQNFGFYPQSRAYFADFAVGPILSIDKFGIKDLQFGRIAQFHEYLKIIIISGSPENLFLKREPPKTTPRATFSENVVFQLSEWPQKFAKTVFQLSNYNKNVMLAWFFQEKTFQAFKYA